ncbi:hypothetical protein Hanom_Chr17g01578221 [Helianthus anomalus]
MNSITALYTAATQSTTRGRVNALWWSRVELWNFVYGGLYSSAEELYTDGINKKGCDTITSDTTPSTFLSLVIEYWLCTWHDLIG